LCLSGQGSSNFFSFHNSYSNGGLFTFILKV
jgi:hypothetical protein